MRQPFRFSGTEQPASVYPIAGLKGYATLVDVDDHEALREVVAGNAMGNIEEYRIIALADLRD